MDARAVHSSADNLSIIDPRLVSLRDPDGPAAEQFRLLHHRIEKARKARPMPVLALTSAAPGEGKSLTAANLAVCAATRGKKVALVDCDLRRPRASELLGVESGPGLVSLLSKKAGLKEATRRGPEGLTVIPAGSSAEEPVRLLDSTRFHQVIEELREGHDEVYLDLPPVLAFADTHVAASAADGLVMVVRSGVTPFEQVQQALEALSGMAVIGCVLTGCDEGVQAYRKYYKRR